MRGPIEPLGKVPQGHKIPIGEAETGEKGSRAPKSLASHEVII
jgi:hypothetical protein